jgi:hypothetical protein
MLNLFQHPIRKVDVFIGSSKPVQGCLASEMPICIGMTAFFISSEHLWCYHRTILNQKSLSFS